MKYNIGALLMENNYPSLFMFTCIDLKKSPGRKVVEEAKQIFPAFFGANKPLNQ